MLLVDIVGVLELGLVVLINIGEWESVGDGGGGGGLGLRLDWLELLECCVLSCVVVWRGDE